MHKMKNLCSAVLVCTCLIFTGCQYLPNNFAKNSDEQSNSALSTESPDSAVIVLEKEDTQEPVQTLPDADLEKVQQTLSEEIYNYAYSQLKPEEQLIYSEILGIIQKHEQEIQVSTLDSELIDRAFNCVMLDHPELFYLTGYSITKYTRGETVEKITLSGSYTMSAEEAAQKQLAVDAYVERCLAGLPENADEYEKVKYVYEYLVRHTEYDLAAPDNQNILSVFINGRSVCQGYAKATQYLLNQLKLFCTLVEGNIKDREAHVWNLVRIDGNYYYVDTTWGDASYSLTADGMDAGVEAPEINYDYLCVPENMIAETHVINETVPLPLCTSLRDNYYVREGIYFENVDEEQIRAAFLTAYEKGNTSVILKCSNDTVYAELYQYLIKEEKVFDFLKWGDSVNYVEMPNQETLLFYL